jgi:Xaa-Pro aminopeptidase
MAEEGLDAIVSFSPESVAYGAGFIIPSQAVPIRKRVFATVVTPQDEALIVASVEGSEAEMRSRIRDIRPYDEFAVDPMQMVADALAEFGAGDGRVAVELDFLPARHAPSLERHLARATIEDAERVIGRMRSIKTLEELESIRKIARVVNDVHVSLAEAARPGWTEKQMALHLIEGILGGGGDGVTMLVVGSGERSVYANCPPTDRVIGDGDVIRVDIYAHVDGYLSDIARTLVVGEPDARQRDIWAKLCEAQTQLLDWIKPGASSLDVMQRFSALFAQMGLNPGINFVGHSLGLTLHEDPFINLSSDHELREGMVLAIEPVYFSDHGGFHLEDEIVLTADGVELLSDGRGEMRAIVGAYA